MNSYPCESGFGTLWLSRPASRRSSRCGKPAMLGWRPQSGIVTFSVDLVNVRKLFLDSQLSALQLLDQRLIGQRTIPFFGDAPFKTCMFGFKSADMRQFHAATSSRTPASSHSGSRIAARAHGPKVRAGMDVSASTRSSGRVVMLPQSPYLASPSASVCPKRAIVRIPVAAKR